VLPDEVPPEWMWPFPEELSDWFDDIREKKKMDMESDSEDTVAPMVKNESPMLERYRALRGGD
jgi:hypothetical protein